MSPDQPIAQLKATVHVPGHARDNQRGFGRAKGIWDLQQFETHYKAARPIRLRDALDFHRRHHCNSSFSSRQLLHTVSPHAILATLLRPKS